MPRTDILSVPFVDQTFLLHERQELSGQTSGLLIAKSFGPAQWRGEWTTAPLRGPEALAYEAKLHSLDGAIGEFYAYDLRHPYPASYPDGEFTDAAKIKTVGSNGKSLSLKGLSAGFTLSSGDYLAFDFGTPARRALHQVVEPATADDDGETAEFEVRPHVRPGASADDDVSLKMPSGIFILVPGSVSHSIVNALYTTISFQAYQVP